MNVPPFFETFCIIYPFARKIEDVLDKIILFLHIPKNILYIYSLYTILPLFSVGNIQFRFSFSLSYFHKRTSVFFKSFVFIPIQFCFMHISCLQNAKIV